jgi:hypothetical protein
MATDTGNTGKEGRNYNNIYEGTQFMRFKCANETGGKNERWEGSITNYIRYESHCEITIQSRSSIMVLFGNTSRGGFACMPDFGAGCHLTDLKDIFWNTEKLVEVLGKVDGITVATALYNLADTIKPLQKH